MKIMKDDDYPALYLAADAASNEAQSTLLRLNAFTNYSLVIGAFLSLFSGECKTAAITSAAAFLVSLCLVIYGHQKKLQSKWYQARALAESIKTATWRLMMGAEPFASKSKDEVERFRKLLDELLIENKGIGEYLGNEWANNNQVTEFMLVTRADNYNNKMSFYLTSRIGEQKDWYVRKSGSNRSESFRWLKLISIFYGGAIACILIRIGWPNLSFLPTDTFAVAASTALAWTQMKRFDELASAYGLTAHEIGIIQSRFSAVSSQEHFVKFVSDSENAFSREHTQWAARRDN